MRPSFYSRLINGPFGDPGLLINLTFRKQTLLFDLGDLSALSPNDLLKVHRIFITHTHMDHFVGFDLLLRLMLGRSRRLFLYGPKGFLGNIAGKLAAYTWNLVQNYSDALVIEATEIDGDRRIRQTFDCRSAFKAAEPRHDHFSADVAHEEPAFCVRTALLDHQIPCLAYSLEEQFHVNILKARLDELGLGVGPWLSAFKTLLFQGADPATEVHAPSVGAPASQRTFGLKELSAKIAHITRGQKIAYITDAVHSPANEEKMIRLAAGADHLFIEAAFLDSEGTIARDKFHLTARQAGLIARQAGAKQMTIFHHSPRYYDQGHLLEAEARAAFEGRH
ncbi:MAG: ribonuclease Z [Desulfobacteraceae bacterium]|nr:MAG: ribonuclease Z [Desulfobacteraceae bacterium]